MATYGPLKRRFDEGSNSSVSRSSVEIEERHRTKLHGYPSEIGSTKSFTRRLQDSSLRGTAIAAFFAGVVATTVTQPFDVWRTHLHLGRQGTLKYNIMFTGLGPRILKRSMSSALIWGIYEMISDLYIE